MSKTNCCGIIACSSTPFVIDEMTAEKTLYEGIGNGDWNGKRLGHPSITSSVIPEGRQEEMA